MRCQRTQGQGQVLACLRESVHQGKQV
ncbi:MAG: hypothetical protein KDD43_04080 [Bdellovibrionales bacterium]|nr:hypothetical protein [Bdellovibrionales bacterium]